MVAVRVGSGVEVCKGVGVYFSTTISGVGRVMGVRSCLAQPAKAKLITINICMKNFPDFLKSMLFNSMILIGHF